MTTLAFGHDGPGAWVLFFPLIWAAVVIGVFAVLRRTGWRGPRPPWRPANSEHEPITVLGRRFASGEIDEDEYWRRLSVLDERFGRDRKGSAA